eukprot:CAMPEP_0184525488 /NCGR_PEP_ID=MMETSP0198_2-20121128/10129_1 /TAXON_ID=1112570 /ORGANISM="Thraustochytrium sp., Strain LLF1b" /LENGTH=60 /DNA_ID=CAMNT_0026916959 /DNA_START=99 /DNA_END=278 /DNA_ORIENTATION=+
MQAEIHKVWVLQRPILLKTPGFSTSGQTSHDGAARHSLAADHDPQWVTVGRSLVDVLDVH